MKPLVTLFLLLAACGKDEPADTGAPIDFGGADDAPSGSTGCSSDEWELTVWNYTDDTIVGIVWSDSDDGDDWYELLDAPLADGDSVTWCLDEGYYAWFFVWDEDEWCGLWEGGAFFGGDTLDWQIFDLDDYCGD